jgi:hypothetical protein
MRKILDRIKLCLLVPIVWPYCLVQCWLGMPQDMSVVNAQIKEEWRDAGSGGPHD